MHSLLRRCDFARAGSRGVLGAFVLLGVGAVGINSADAQWSSNPSVNTVMSGAGDQAVSIARPRTDGGFWLSFFDNSAGGGYKPVLQRYTACGTLAASVVAGPTRTNSGIFTYDMRVGPEGQAYISYDNSGMFLQRVEPDGSTPWGATGVLMPSSTATTFGSKLAVCGDGTIVVAIGLNVTGTGAINAINFQRFNADGTLGNAWQFVETTRAQNPSDIIPSGTGGDVICLWARNETTNATTSRRGLKIQRYNSAGVGQWNGGVPIDVVASSGTAPTRSLQSAYFPAMQPDGSGGAVIAWYETGTNRLAYLQHYSAEGIARFPVGGLPLSTVPVSSEFRLSASVGYHAPSESYVIAYMRSNTAQSQFGLAAQRVNWDGTAGTLAWNSGAGVEILPVSATTWQSNFIDVQRAPNGDAIATWIQFQGASSPHQIQATRLSDTGTPIWTPAITVAASNPTSKGRMSVARLAHRNGVVGVWQDGAAGSADMVGQLVNFDGTLGAPGPSLTSSPQNASICNGQSAPFSVSACTLVGTPTFQWRRNGVDITGATSATLTINPAYPSAIGDYDCVVGTDPISATAVSFSARLSMCLSDFDCSGGTNIDDLFAFLSAWFTNDPRCDLDGSGGATIDDLFNYLSVWFGGC